MSNRDVERINAFYKQYINTRDPLQSVCKKQHARPLVADGVGTKIDICNICSKKDCVYPIRSIHLCPNCMKHGHWTRSMVKFIRDGTCAICGQQFSGAGAYIDSAQACIKCLWTKLGKKNCGLRTDAGRLV
jgi:hypothetical protein